MKGELSRPPAAAAAGDDDGADEDARQSCCWFVSLGERGRSQPVDHAVLQRQALGTEDGSS